MKQYTYTQNQVDYIYSYLLDRPMKETEGLVQIMRTPVAVTEVPDPEQPAESAPQTEGQEKANEEETN